MASADDGVGNVGLAEEAGRLVAGTVPVASLALDIALGNGGVEDRGTVAGVADDVGAVGRELGDGGGGVGGAAGRRRVARDTLAPGLEALRGRGIGLASTGKGDADVGVADVAELADAGKVGRVAAPERDGGRLDADRLAVGDGVEVGRARMCPVARLRQQRRLRPRIEVVSGRRRDGRQMGLDGSGQAIASQGQEADDSPRSLHLASPLLDGLELRWTTGKECAPGKPLYDTGPRCNRPPSRGLAI